MTARPARLLHHEKSQRFFFNFIKSRVWTNVYKIVISTTNKPVGVQPRCEMELEFMYMKYVSGNLVSQIDTRFLLRLGFGRVCKVAKSDC